MSTRIVFRTDASTTMGWGHVARCMTLACGLRARGRAPEFVCCETNGHPGNWLQSLGFPVTLLAMGRREWTWESDASATRQVIEATSAPVDWLIVDHYDLDAQWESALRSSVGRIMAIDDLADRPHEADILFDQNIIKNAHCRYDGLVPGACVRLLGPEWSLLGPAYAEAHARMPARVGRIERILVSFGSADVQAATTRVVEALLRVGRADLVIDVVVPVWSWQLERLHTLMGDQPNLHLHTDVPTLLPLLALADLSIGACGVTSWERLTMGVPSVVLTLAENQRPIAEELHRRGLVRWLGDAVDMSAAGLDSALATVLAGELDEGWSTACLATMDGRGLTRTLAVLLADAGCPLNARTAGPGDEARTLEWANDPGTRRTALTKGPISVETHRGWFRRRLRDMDGCEFFIVETADQVPVGQVRFEEQGTGDWEVHYLVAPVFRGRGLGQQVMQTALARFVNIRGALTVVGRVKPDNVPSCRIFEALGFERVSAADAAVCTYQLSNV
jgi:UDP-2,4-diacetamido-2,4,6-trideoxy-beta-L-altropyranose hydrolase